MVASPLSREELELIRRLLGREPTRVELVMFEAQWSEHCSYKSSRPLLRMLPSEAPWVLVGPGRDAAVVKLWDDVAVAFRVESHNHPSAVDPYNGAATGVGGIVRDVLAVGAKPVALLDMLYLGDPGDSHARWLASNIVRGISDYGNRIGVPTVAGEVWFDESYNRQPLVNVACVGLVHPDRIVPGIVEPGDEIIIVGNSTGRDGLLGSSFASKPLEGGEEELAAIQVGNPLLEKLLIDFIVEAASRGWLKHVKDLGGGGLATAVAESCERSGVGAEVHLDRLHLREPDMTPEEIVASESQERMLVVPRREFRDEVLALAEKLGLEYSVIGVFTSEPRLRFYYRGELVADVPVEALARAPEVYRQAHPPMGWPRRSSIRVPEPPDLAEALLAVLSSPSIAGKLWVWEQYDWGVQGRTRLPPGYGDAAVLWLRDGSRRGLAVKGDANPRYTWLDPFRGAAISLEEAYRNVVAVGGEPLAAVDNLNAGNPEKPDQFWFFKEMVEGLAWAARELGIPIVGGNVSLYNEDARGRMVKPTATVVVVGRVDDVTRSPGASLRGGGELLLVGDTLPELGGSALLAEVYGVIDGAPPVPRLGEEVRAAKLILEVVRRGLASSIHDVSDGGVVVAAAEMAALGGVGFELDVSAVGCRACRGRHEALFSETQARYLVEATSSAAEEIMELASKLGVPVRRVGSTGGSTCRVVEGGRSVFELDVREIRRAYWGSLEERMG